MFSSQDLLNGLRNTQLNDPEATTWPDASLIAALNEALRTLVLVRPDANPKISTVMIIDGTRQYIPTDGLRLLRVVRNIGADDSIGGAVRLVQQEDMDSMSPNWHTTQGYVVKEYMYDIRTPKYFYIYPAVTPGQKLEIEYSATVTPITDITVNDELPVAQVFSQPIQELILYKLLSGDSVNGNSGAQHLQTAMELLGVKDSGDDRASSARRTQT